MELGWCDVCLRVASAKASREYYAHLGFRRVEGDDDEGWAVMTNDDVRLGLYEAKHMGEETVMLNFRGGDVAKNAEALKAKGLAASTDLLQSPEGTSITFRDPDGYAVFLDTGTGETKKT